MKVAWFANTPCGAIDLLAPNLHIGGWLHALNKVLEIQEDVDLSVCFFWPKQLAPFRHNSTNYYPIYRSTKLSNVFRKFGRAQNLDEQSQITSILEEISPDIIHIHGTEDCFGLIQTLTNIPTVISLQGIISAYLEFYFSGIPVHAVMRHGSYLDFFSIKHPLIEYARMIKKSKIEMDILRSATNIMGRTAWDKRIASILSPNGRYWVGQEILRPVFYEHRWQKQNFDSPLKIVTTMSGGLYKGMEQIEKIVEFLSKLTTLEFVWTVVGQKEGDSVPKITRGWLNTKGREKHITFVGPKTDAELCDILCESDIFCQVSHIENSPNSLCEAMLVGMPIIASNAGGTSTLLTDGEDGVLVQSGDPYATAGAILEMTRNFKEAQNFAASARTKAMLRHSSSTIAESLVRTYGKILDA